MDIIGLIPSFGNVIFTIIAFVIALSVIVAVHEYGHYIVGRWCGIKAEVFSLGFGPVIYAKPDKHGTVWQVAALPFGGYVKFLGDANAASVGSSEDEVDPAALRQTMHGAPLWARAATVAAGPVFNFILSIIVFALFAVAVGRATEPFEIADIKPLPAEYASLEAGDIVLAVEGREISNVSELLSLARDLPVEPTLDYRVMRDGSEQMAEGPFPFPALVGSITPGLGAERAGLQAGDVIVGIDGDPIVAFHQLQKVAIESEGRELRLSVWRDGEILDFSFATIKRAIPTDNGMEERWQIGLGGTTPFEPAVRSVGAFEAAKLGVVQTKDIIVGSMNGLYAMVAGRIGSCNLSGPIGIAKVSGSAASQGLDSFIWMIAVLSTAVGLLNLFPIPVLDGGHLVFHAYEAVTGRPPSEQALRVLMGIGLALLLGLMVFALTNDLFCP